MYIRTCAQFAEAFKRYVQVAWKAAALLAAGAAVCAVISDPMVDAVSSFSKVALLASTLAAMSFKLIMTIWQDERNTWKLTYVHITCLVALCQTVC